MFAMQESPGRNAGFFASILSEAASRVDRLRQRPPIRTVKRKMEGTAFSLHSTARPEAMADVPGVCELPLTRAVVHYRDLHEVDPPGGRIQDIGLALVLEGRFASSPKSWIWEAPL